MHTRGGGGGIEDLSSKGDKELLTGGLQMNTRMWSVMVVPRLLAEITHK